MTRMLYCDLSAMARLMAAMTALSVLGAVLVEHAQVDDLRARGDSLQVAEAADAVRGRAAARQDAGHVGAILPNSGVVAVVAREPFVVDDDGTVEVLSVGDAAIDHGHADAGAGEAHVPGGGGVD